MAGLQLLIYYIDKLYKEKPMNATTPTSFPFPPHPTNTHREPHVFRQVVSLCVIDRVGRTYVWLRLQWFKAFIWVCVCIQVYLAIPLTQYVPIYVAYSIESSVLILKHTHIHTHTTKEPYKCIFENKCLPLTIFSPTS